MTGCRIGRVRFRSGGEVRILPAAAPLSEAQDDQVAMLTHALSQVRSGEWRSVAVVAINRDGSATPTRWSLADGDGMHLATMVSALQHDLMGARG